jgi:hypothetical protein
MTTVSPGGGSASTFGMSVVVYNGSALVTPYAQFPTTEGSSVAVSTGGGGGGTTVEPGPGSANTNGGPVLFYNGSTVVPVGATYPQTIGGNVSVVTSGGGGGSGGAISRSLMRPLSKDLFRSIA